MALTALKTLSLADQEFTTLYTDHEALWLQKAKDAHSYTTLLVKPTGEKVRQDDVLLALEPAVEAAPEFRKHVAKKRLHQKYWKTYFSEFILDRTWSKL